ncbi:MAG: hypothetical protein AVDCRST_MAG87-3082, partial [uncultured Thermomicrobiales bacterium]
GNGQGSCLWHGVRQQSGGSTNQLSGSILFLLLTGLPPHVRGESQGVRQQLRCLQRRSGRIGNAVL